jgi:hypothetical protein
MKMRKRMPMTEEMPLTTTSGALAAVPEEINEEGPMEAIPAQETAVPYEVVMAEAESEEPQLRLYHALMMDYEENPLRLEDDFDDLDDDPN